jgi:hypothetical protein
MRASGNPVPFFPPSTCRRRLFNEMINDRIPLGHTGSLSNCKLLGYLRSGATLPAMWATCPRWRQSGSWMDIASRHGAHHRPVTWRLQRRHIKTRWRSTRKHHSSHRAPLVIIFVISPSPSAPPHTFPIVDNVSKRVSASVRAAVIETLIDRRSQTAQLRDSRDDVGCPNASPRAQE